MDKKKNLILCCTMYQLINVINLVINFLEDDENHLILSHDSNFDIIINEIKETKLFKNIYRINSYTEAVRKFRDILSLKEIKIILKDPIKLFDNEYLKHILNNEYTDFFIIGDSVFSRCLFYAVNLNKNINIHFYEDGFFSYVNNWHYGLPVEKFDDSIYNNLYDKSIKSYYIYEPELYCGTNLKIPLIQIPKITLNNKVFDIVFSIFKNLDVFGKDKKFVFFEEAFIDKYMFVEDFKAIVDISNFIKKDSILVKLHPRITNDRFTPRGFDVLKKSMLPWEASIMHLFQKNHKFVTISFASTASLTSRIVFNIESYTILLYKMPYIGANRVVKSNNEKSFMNKVVKKYNSENQFIFTPTSIQELGEILQYLENLIK